MCLAQGLQRSDAGKAQTHGLSVLSQAWVKHSTTEPLRSHKSSYSIDIYKLTVKVKAILDVQTNNIFFKCKDQLDRLANFFIISTVKPV